MGETLFHFWQKIWCKVVETAFSVTGVSFSGIFLRTKFCLTVIGFRCVSKVLVKNVLQVCQNRSLHVSANFWWKSVEFDNINCLKFFRFLGRNFLGVLEEKTRQGCQNYLLKIKRKFWIFWDFKRKGFGLWKKFSEERR